MNRREILLASLALLAPSIPRAQQGGKIYRVGMLFPASPVADITGADPVHVGVRSFVRAMRELGYVEGRNLTLDRVSAEHRGERYSEIIAELLGRRPDAIVVTGSEIALAAMKATSTVPIVMSGVARPVKYRLVASRERPGGNVTGLAANVSPENEGKRLELLGDLVPGLTRVCCLATKWVWEGPVGNTVRRRAAEIGLALLFAEHMPNNLGATIANIVRQHPDALFVAQSPAVYSQHKQIVDFALEARLPGIYPFAEMAQEGGLMSYGVDLSDLFRRAANYVDKILKGATPAELPVEQPTAFEFVVNLKTAKALGIAFSRDLLSRANRVIE